MSEGGKRLWNAKIVIGTIFLITSALIFAVSFRRERLGFGPTDIYTYRNALAFLAAGALLICWRLVRGQ